MNVKLIVGLGNVGKQFVGTRHNVGFMVVDEFLRRCGSAEGARYESKKAYELARVAFADQQQPVLVMKPSLLMNRSGQPVLDVVQTHRIHRRTGLLVVLDDFHLPLGAVRLRPQGGTGGQKGLASVIAKLGGSQRITRLRVGIRPPGPMHTAEIMQRWTSDQRARFVLEKFTAAERQELLPNAVSRAVDCIEYWLKHGPVKTMEKFNAIPK